jgi:hypothetical protein
MTDKSITAPILKGSNHPALLLTVGVCQQLLAFQMSRGSTDSPSASRSSWTMARP